MTNILIEKNVPVQMSNGVHLATDIYRPVGNTPVPVLLARTPYNKETIVRGDDTFSVLRAVQAGYAVVVQDVRGRYASEGAFAPHVQETQDGVDAIAWAVAQEPAEQYVPAINRVCHDAAYPSHLLLPIIERRGRPCAT